MLLPSRVLPRSLRDAVECDPQGEDRNRRDHALPELPANEALRDLVPEPPGSDEPADDDDGEHHDDRLVHAEHHGVTGERQLDLRQHLSSRGAERTRGLDRRRRHVAHSTLDEPQRHGEGVEDAGDDPRHDRDRHQVDERDDVDELRQRLQHVVDRSHRLREAVVLGGQHAEHDADHDGHRRRDEHLRERVHGQCPDAHDSDQREHRERRQCRSEPADDERDQRQPADRREPWSLDQERLHRQQELLEDEDPDPLGDGEHPRRGVLHVVEDDLDLRQQPLLDGRAAWWISDLVGVEGIGAERLRDPDRTENRGHQREGLEAQSLPPRLVEVPVRRVRPRRHGLGRAVERDRHDHDHEAGEDRERGVRVETARHDCAEPASADEARDHDHREREQDRLVDAEKNQSASERQLDLAEQLRSRRAQRGRRLDRVHRDAADAERRDPDRRRNRVDQRRDHRCGRPDREEDDDRASGRRRRERSASRRGAGVIAFAKRSERPATMPSGMPMRSESPTATSISASVCMLSSQRPVSANVANATSVIERCAQAAEPRNDEHAGNRRPDPGHPEQEAVEPVDEVVDRRREAVEEREDEAPMSASPFSVRSHTWKVVEVAGERSSRSANRATGTRIVRPFASTVTPHARYARYMSATIACGLDDLPAPPRHVREDGGAAVPRPRRRPTSVIAALAGDRREHGDAVDDSDDAAVLDRADRLARSSATTGIGTSDGGRDVEPAVRRSARPAPGRA